MLVRNPQLHYPKFLAKVIYHDGRELVCRGSAEPEELAFPGEEDEILTIVLTTQDAGSRVIAKMMWVDGRWKKYDEEVVAQLQAPPKPEPKPEPEPEPEPEPKPEPKPVREVGKQIAKELRRDKRHEVQKEVKSEEDE